MTLEDTLSQRLSTAVTSAFGEQYADTDPLLRAATRPEFGHLQTNLPLRLAKPLGLPPREVGARLLDALDVADLCLPPELAGAGFVNLTWRSDVLAARVNDLLVSTSSTAEDTGQTVVIDYSQPNVAKQMHVGHLRSTVIGDALARVLVYAGHRVVRRNHLGDWGTQFGMLIEQLHDEHAEDVTDLGALDALYKRARKRFEADDAFVDRARARVVLLQSGDAATVASWKRLVDSSLTAFQATYDRMGALLTPADAVGESSYNDALPGVVDDLVDLGLLTESDGAMVAFLPGFVRRDGEPLPLIVRKSDGGYGYVATDLAAIRDRVDRLGADRIVYVVDARQSLHFEQVFALARLAGWLPETVEARHVAFGSVLGEDGKPFKTRSGETVSLTSLLDAAEEKAGREVGIGAVKYADLSNGLGRDYVFALDRMLATEGNTSRYLQYAHARLCSVLDRAGEVRDATVGALDHPAEQRLALVLSDFPGVVDKVADTLEPHHLCTYLYGLAVALSTFYEQCPVLRAEGESRRTRVTLCLATRNVLATGLDLLGISAPTRM